MHDANSIRRDGTVHDRELLVAVFVRGVQDLKGKDAREKARAEEWMDETVRDNPFSFAGLCEALGLPTERVRREIMTREIDFSGVLQ